MEDDPDLTDRKFPGSPTKFYRSSHPFKVMGARLSKSKQ